MTPSVLRLRAAAGALALLAGLTAISTSGVAAPGTGDIKAVLGDTDYATLIESELKTLQESVNAAATAKVAKDIKANKRKAMTSAVLLAAYAQAQIGKGVKTAGIRDEAVKVYEAVQGDKFADAKAAAAKITPDGEGLAGKTSPIELTKLPKYELGELMHVFGTEKSGGQALEKKLESARNKKVTAFAEVKLLCDKCAVIGQLSEQFTPAKDEGKKLIKDWVKLSQDMTASSVEASKAAAKKDAAALKKSLEALDVSCSGCHSVWRDN